MNRPIPKLGQPHGYAGCLIVVEGTDGSGKSTQLQLLQNWLELEGFGTCFTEWNSSLLVSRVIKKGKRRGRLTPTTFSLLHATDFADRIESIIRPALQAGLIVLADRYMYTAFARDVARGVDRDWVRNAYAFALIPDAAYYFRVDIETSLLRISATRAPKFYEAGMDLGLSDDPYESYRVFQSRVIEEYDAMVDDLGLAVIDGTRPIHEQQTDFRAHVREVVNDRFGADALPFPIGRVSELPEAMPGASLGEVGNAGATDQE
jgi:dTMP kinase